MLLHKVFFNMVSSKVTGFLSDLYLINQLIIRLNKRNTDVVYVLISWAQLENLRYKSMMVMTRLKGYALIVLDS